MRPLRFIAALGFAGALVYRQLRFERAIADGQRQLADGVVEAFRARDKELRKFTEEVVAHLRDQRASLGFNVPVGAVEIFACDREPTEGRIRGERHE